MQTSLQSLIGSQFLQAGFLKARLLVSQHIFLEAGPRVFLSFMREDKQVVTLEIFWAPDEINARTDILNILIHEKDLTKVTDSVNMVLELDAKESMKLLQCSHLFCYFDPEVPYPPIITTPAEISNQAWSAASMIVFFLSDTYRILLEKGERYESCQLHFIDEQKNPGYLIQYLEERGPLRDYQIF